MSDPSQNNIGAQTPARSEKIIAVRDLVVGFGDRLVMNGLDLDVYRGEVLGFVGGSGQGKSVLMRTILGLIPQAARARSRCLARTATPLPDAARRALEQRWGVLFQHGALFSCLTVKQNIQVPMRENRDLSDR